MESTPPQREPRRTSKYYEGQNQLPHLSLRHEINELLKQTQDSTDEGKLFKIEVLQHCLSNNLLLDFSGRLQRPPFRRRTHPGNRMYPRMKLYSVLDVIEEEPITPSVEQDDLTEDSSIQAGRIVQDKMYTEHKEMELTTLTELVDSDKMKLNMQFEQINDTVEPTIQSDQVSQKDLEEIAQAEKVKLENDDVTVDITMKLSLVGIVQNEINPVTQEEIESTIQPSLVKPDKVGSIEHSNEINDKESTTDLEQVEHDELDSVVQSDINHELPFQTG